MDGLKTIVVDGVEFEVVWNGGELLAPRDQKPSEFWPKTPERKRGRRRKLDKYADEDDNERLSSRGHDLHAAD